MPRPYRRDDHLYARPDVVIPFRLIVAPFVRQAKLFIERSGYYPGECKIVTRREQLHGIDASTWEVWWLTGMWPMSTHGDIERMQEMYTYLRCRGADIRRWWT